MNALATLYGMTQERKPRIETRVTRALRARRGYLKKTQELMADQSDGLLNTRLLSELENGVRRIDTLTLPKLRALLKALDWSGEDLYQETGVEVPMAAPIPGSLDYLATYDVPRFGSVGAGLSDDGEPDPNQRPFPLDPKLPWLRGRDLSRMVVMTVNGDSMVSPKAAARQSVFLASILYPAGP